MGRIREAADGAARRYRWGRVRFYVALVMLGVLAVAFAAVAVLYARADVPDADEAVAAGVVGAVMCPTVAVWGVHSLSRGSPRWSLRQWFPVLVLAALVVIGLGLWQVAVGNASAGVPLMFIALADVVIVAVVARRDRKRPGA